MLRAMGWATEDLVLPQAGVAASWNKVTPCNMHLDALAVAAGEELQSLRGAAAPLPHDLGLGRDRDGHRGDARLAAVA